MLTLLLRLKRFCGIIVGFIFFLSGIVKLMDPVGAGLVMSEYYSFLHIDFMDFSAKFMGTVFALAETIIGAAIITGVWRRVIAVCALGIQIFFTLITLLLVIFSPEMDCGCFGEAIHMTHMQTFIKNIILLALLLAYMFPIAHLGETKKISYISFSIVTLSVMGFTIYSWLYIPLVDFTAYKPGAKLIAGATIDPEEMFETVFTYEKDGTEEIFTLENLPDSTWTFVSTYTRENKDLTKGFIELSFYCPETGEDMDTLATKGKVMVISVYDTEMNSSKWKDVKNFKNRSEKAGFTTLLLCSRPEHIPSSLKGDTYISDCKTLISMNRSNGGVTYFYDGTLIGKWARISAPEDSELKEIAQNDPTEVSIDKESKGSLVFQGFLLYVFAIMLLL